MNIRERLRNTEGSRIKGIQYDSNGISLVRFKKDDFYVRLKIDYRNKIIYIIRDDTLYAIFKKQFKSEKTLRRQARVCIMKFCGFSFPKKGNFHVRGKKIKKG